MNHPRRCYVFAGGGTGGHLFPGIAVVEQLQKLDADTRCVFVGTDRLTERAIVAASGCEHVPLAVESTAMLRRHPLRVARSLTSAYGRCLRLLREWQPDAVIGLGGYASLPVVLAARRLKLPIVLMEQNVVPGRATRWLSRFADHICVTFEETVPRLPHAKHVVVTGNPVRREIVTAAVQQTTFPQRTTLLVLGGSQGASVLNRAVPAALGDAGDILSGWNIVHQTGEADHDQVTAAYASYGLPARVEPFLTDMAEQYRHAGLVISRAGGTSLAEFAVTGTPAILVPYPDSIGDHQLHNATWFVWAGAADLIEQPPGDEVWFQSMLAETIKHSLCHSVQREAMSQAMRDVARPDAAHDVAAMMNGLS